MWGAIRIIVVASFANGYKTGPSRHKVIQQAKTGNLLFDNGSRAYLSRGSIDALEILGSSDVTYCDVTPGSTNVGIGSTGDLLAGTMPDMQFPSAWVADQQLPLNVTGQPFSLWLVVFSFRRDYIDLPDDTFSELAKRSSASREQAYLKLMKALGA